MSSDLEEIAQSLAANASALLQEATPSVENADDETTISSSSTTADAAWLLLQEWTTKGQEWLSNTAGGWPFSFSSSFQSLKSLLRLKYTETLQHTKTVVCDEHGLCTAPQKFKFFQAAYTKLPDPQSKLAEAYSFLIFHIKDRPILALGIVLGILLMIGLIQFALDKWRLRRLQARPDMIRSSSLLNTDQEMEVLRATRDRSTTYDFFGMHQQQQRNRSGSISSLNDSLKFRHHRSGSMDFLKRSAGITDAARQRSGSLDLRSDAGGGGGGSSLALAGASSYLDGGYLYDEFGLVHVSDKIDYYGPTVDTIQYPTWTPPTSWKEASQSILPQDIMLKLKRTLILKPKEQGKLLIQEPESQGKWDVSLEVPECSSHVVPPSEGGVLNLYLKGSPKEEWKEYTFDSAQEAAQFQLDLLSYQVFGTVLHSMFQVLSMVHEGSIAHRGREFVLHDTKIVAENDSSVKSNIDASSDESKKQGSSDKEEEVSSNAQDPSRKGVAWDDAMRALGSIPSVRIALERLWLHHRNQQFLESVSASIPNKTSKASAGAKQATEPAPSSSQDKLLDPSLSNMPEDYHKKRLLLGPIDFFRLFVPVLPDTALPEAESRRDRMEQLLRWRKRTARAAVLAKSYTLSHRVVNQGWFIQPGQTSTEDKPDKELVRRIAYDDNEDNNERDLTAKNEYYEGTVSRDIMCYVRPYDYFSPADEASSTGSKRKFVLSPCQAFSLVGVNVFEIPTGSEPNPLDPSQDPVRALPSLRELIESHPEIDFSVTAHYPTARQVAIVVVHARSLAKGVDPQFDNVLDRYTQGDEETRNQRLYLMLQLGPYLGISFFGWVMLRILSFLLTLTRKGKESKAPVETRRDRLPFPAIHLTKYAKLRHFGGALQKDPTLPQNYISMTAIYSPKYMPNILCRIFFYGVEKVCLTSTIMDFTFLIEAQSADELPERALSTTRMVHVDVNEIALPVGTHIRDAGCCSMTPSSIRASISTAFQSILGSFQTDAPTNAQQPTPQPDVDSELQGESMDPDELSEHFDFFQQSDDPFELASNEIADILKDVEIPVRKDQLKIGTDVHMHSAKEYLERNEAVVPVPILRMINRNDIKRFYKGSNCSLKTAAVRLVQTAAWRGEMFPVDLRRCRIELQSGQFFQQGTDLEGNPVFYFRHLCLGPWRGNEDGVIYAVLHRLEDCLQQLASEKPDVKCTIVVLMGRPYGEKKTKPPKKAKKKNKEDEAASDDESHHDVTPVQTRLLSNPRISPEETLQSHTNRNVIRRLSHVLITHYPERLSKLLILSGVGRNKYYITPLKGRKLVNSLVGPNIKTKIKFLDKPDALKNYIHSSQLSVLVGGDVAIDPSVFECL